MAPASPERAPLWRRARVQTRATLIPAARAASGLRSTTRSWKPKRVCQRTRQRQGEPGPGRRQGAPEELSFRPDVEEAAPERPGDGQAGEQDRASELEGLDPGGLAPERAGEQQGDDLPRPGADDQGGERDDG